MKKKKENTVVLTILSFLLSVFLTMLCLLIGLKAGLFNQATIFGAMKNTQYYTHVVEETVDEAENLIIPMGLDNSVLDDVFTKEQAEKDCKTVIRAKLASDDTPLDLTDLNDKLTANVHQYIQTQRIELNEEQENNITVFTNAVLQFYSQNISIPFISYYVSIRSMLAKVILIGIAVLLVLTLITILLIVKAGRRRRTFLPYITYATLAGMLMTVLVPAGLLLQGAYRRLNISPEYVFRFAVRFITSSLVAFLYIGIVMLIISLILMIVTSRLKVANSKRATGSKRNGTSARKGVNSPRKAPQKHIPNDEFSDDDILEIIDIPDK